MSKCEKVKQNDPILGRYKHADYSLNYGAGLHVNDVNLDIAAQMSIVLSTAYQQTGKYLPKQNPFSSLSNEYITFSNSRCGEQYCLNRLFVSSLYRNTVQMQNCSI